MTKNSMKNIIAFSGSAIIAAICAFIYTANIIPAGEGSFGIAKMAPFLLVRSVFELFGLIWFPANLVSVFAFRKKGSQYPPGEVIVTVASAILFAYAAGSFGRDLYHMHFSKVHFEEIREDHRFTAGAGAALCGYGGGVALFENSDGIAERRLPLATALAL